jgi:hypothetical protein
MPYKSEAQRKFFHTLTAKKMGIKPETVKEFDNVSKGLKLPKFSKIKNKIKPIKI